MTGEDTLVLHLHDVPDLGVRVVRARYKFLTRGAPAQVADRLLVRDYRLEVHEVAVPELQLSEPVATDHARFVRCPLHAPHRTLVGLQHVLEVEESAVPKGELAALRRRADAATVRRPVHAVNL